MVRTSIGKKKYKVKRKILKSEVGYIKEKKVIDKCINEIKDEVKNKIEEYKIEFEKESKENELNEKFKIGIYAAGNDWRKNVYNSFASDSLINNNNWINGRNKCS